MRYLGLLINKDTFGHTPRYQFDYFGNLHDKPFCFVPWVVLTVGTDIWLDIIFFWPFYVSNSCWQWFWLEKAASQLQFIWCWFTFFPKHSGMQNHEFFSKIFKAIAIFWGCLHEEYNSTAYRKKYLQRQPLILLQVHLCTLHKWNSDQRKSTHLNHQNQSKRCLPLEY